MLKFFFFPSAWKHLFFSLNALFKDSAEHPPAQHRRRGILSQAVTMWSRGRYCDIKRGEGAMRFH